MNYYSAVGIICLFLSLIIPGIADISVNPVYSIGEEIIIEGFTNFNIDNSVLIEVWPASFGPKAKYQPEMTGGGSVIVPVTSSNNSVNSWGGRFDSSGWSPDNYMVRAEVIGKSYVETTHFELTEKTEETIVSPVPTVTFVEPEKTGAGPEETAIVPETFSTPEIIQTSPVPTKQSPLNLFGLIFSLMCLAGIFRLKVRR